MWCATGDVIGALLGRFATGTTTGAATGASLDRVLFDRCECRGCGHTFDRLYYCGVPSVRETILG